MTSLGYENFNDRVRFTPSRRGNGGYRKQGAPTVHFTIGKKKQQSLFLSRHFLSKVAKSTHDDDLRAIKSLIIDYSPSRKSLLLGFLKEAEVDGTFHISYSKRDNFYGGSVAVTHVMRDIGGISWTTKRYEPTSVKVGGEIMWEIKLDELVPRKPVGHKFQ